MDQVEVNIIFADYSSDMLNEEWGWEYFAPLVDGRGYWGTERQARMGDGYSYHKSGAGYFRGNFGMGNGFIVNGDPLSSSFGNGMGIIAINHLIF